MADRLYTSAEADDILGELHLATKLEKATLARMAFALSLVKAGAEVPSGRDFSGMQLHRATFFGDNELFYKSLLVFAYKRPGLEEDELFSNRSLVKNHIDHGAALLADMFRECGGDGDALLSRLAGETALTGGRERPGEGLKLLLGRDMLERREVVMALNDTAAHANSHLAIMGKPGVGKTQFLLKMLADIRTQSRFQTNFIYFDYKGDVAQNERFLSVTRAHAYRLMQAGSSMPVNPFVLPAYDEQSIAVSAREKAESFACINSKLGPVQRGALTEAIRAGYAKRAEEPLPYPDFRDILDIARASYAADKKKDDTLIEILRDLAEFGLFWKHGDETPPIERLIDRTLLIDLHAMPVLKELAAYLVIERLYKEMAALPDTPVVDGHRTIRTVLAIDEAHNYLNQKNIFLQRIIREGRSKGVAVFFASQSPNDFQQDFFNFQELLEFAYIFQCEAVMPPAIQKILGCSARTAKDLQTEIARLEPWQVITRSASASAEFEKFTAESFFRNY